MLYTIFLALLFLFVIGVMFEICYYLTAPEDDRTFYGGAITGILMMGAACLAKSFLTYAQIVSVGTVLGVIAILFLIFLMFKGDDEE